MPDKSFSDATNTPKGKRGPRETFSGGKRKKMHRFSGIRKTKQDYLAL